MAVWNAPGRCQANPQKSSEWNRGAHVVEGAAHCGICHTPKNMLGGDKTDRALEGATLLGWFAPDITDGPHKGIGAWSKAELVQYLKTGTNRWTLASGPMAEVVTRSTSKMTDEDISAIAIYLKDRGKAVPRWCEWCWKCARRRRTACRRLWRCRRLPGGSMMRRSPPSSPTSGIAGAMRRRPWPQVQSRSSARRWSPRRNFVDVVSQSRPLLGGAVSRHLWCDRILPSRECPAPGSAARATDQADEG
jgi:mono/diheme cytochrome c family protein